jgi:hypothetical protein
LINDVPNDVGTYAFRSSNKSKKIGQEFVITGAAADVLVRGHGWGTRMVWR